MTPLNEVLQHGEYRDALRGLVECMRQAYADASDLHHPEVGSDARTYGMSVYSFVWHRISESGLVKVTAKEPYWFALGAEMVASHRVTGPAGAGIESCFPRDRSGWPSTVARQETFDFAPCPGVTRNVLVLAHMGNEAEGLLEVHLCRPLVDEHGHLTCWLETAPIWRRGEGEVASAAGAAAAQRSAKPLEENKPMPSVTLKKKGKKDAEDAAE